MFLYYINFTISIIITQLNNNNKYTCIHIFIWQYTNNNDDDDDDNNNNDNSYY